jgi:hypothetical protein
MRGEVLASPPAPEEIAPAKPHYESSHRIISLVQKTVKIKFEMFVFSGEP